MLGSWDTPKDTNNAAYTGQLLYVSSGRMFPNRTFPWHMFHELIQQKIKNCNVWWWVVTLVTGPAPWTEPSGQSVWLLESSSGGVKDWSSRCQSHRYSWCDIARALLSEDVSSQRTAPSLWSAALPLHSCVCVEGGGNLRLLDEWSTETITIIVPRQHELSWMLKLRTIPKSAWTCVDYNAFVETEWLLLRRCNLSNIDGRVYVRDRVSVRVIFSITWYVPDTVTYVWQVAAS